MASYLIIEGRSHFLIPLFQISIHILRYVPYSAIRISSDNAGDR